MLEKLSKFEQRYREVELLLADPDNSDNPKLLAELGKEYSQLESKSKTYLKYNALLKSITSLNQIISSEDDKELRPKPVPLEQREVDSILKQIESEAPKVRIGYVVDQSVRINDGPFADFIGTVDQVMSDRGKVRILVSFFGRETPVELDFLQVEKL